MTQVLTPAAPGQLLIDRVDRYERTIATYDQSAAEHAYRLTQTDFGTYLARFTAELPVGAVVLDGGCGAGRDLAWLDSHGFRSIGLDLSVGMLTQARHAAPAATLLHGDLRKIPLSDATVDGVWLCASLLHLAPPDAASALGEVRRVLKPGGRVFISTAAGQGSYWRASKLGPRWFQLYTEPNLARIVAEAGLATIDSVTEPGLVLGSWVNLTAQRPD